MKLLFAIKALDNIQGGAERVLADVTSGLADKGHDVSIVTFDKPGNRPFYPLHKNVTYICLGIGNVYEKATAIETMSRMKAFRKTAKNIKPDIVIPFMHSSFVLAAFSLIGTKIPVIASEHIVPAHYKSRKVEFLFLLASSIFIKKITVLSDSVKKSYPRCLQKKMVAIANPVHKATSFADPSGKNNQTKIILNVGRLDYQKDQATLIRAFKTLAHQYPEWIVKIMGEGPLRGDLEQLIKKENLEGRVFLPGTTSDIEQEYLNAQIFALPSLYESFGLATAEAMAHGLPVIGFADCPGTNELIKDGKNGILVTGKDRVKSLSAALERLILSPDLRISLSENARKSIKPFQKEKIVEEWEQLLLKQLS